MPTLTIEYQTDAERLILEQAIAFTAGLKRLAFTAPDGTVLVVRQSGFDSFDHWVQSPQLDTRFRRGELPMNFAFGTVAV